MQPKLYTINDHLIPPHKIDKHAYYVIQKLKQNGFTAYLVGGSVRDLLLDQKPKDFDISTSAKPEELKKLFRNCILIGKRFRLAHVRFGKKILEVSTFRSGDTENSTLIIRDNDYGTEEQDVLRRDFTINGLFYDPEMQTIIDYVGGYPDIEKKVLSTIGKAETRFRQDPVRMIRLLKFHARFDLEIEPSSLKALDVCKEEIMKSSKARIFEELLRMLESGASRSFFENLSKYGFLELLIPTLASYQNKEKMYALLHQIDQEIQMNDLQRPLLMSCLIFPIFQEIIEEKTKKKTLHLGIIAKNAHILVDEIFHPFFHIPRKMKGTISSILTSQYRFVPLVEKSKKKKRIPKDPNFFEALLFFKVRSAVDPNLLPTYDQWMEVASKIDIQTVKKRPLKKRKKRNVKKSSD